MSIFLIENSFAEETSRIDGAEAQHVAASEGFTRRKENKVGAVALGAALGGRAKIFRRLRRLQPPWFKERNC